MRTTVISRTVVPILFLILLLVSGAVPAGASGTADDAGTAVRASTVSGGVTLMQVAAEPPVAGGQPAWIGLIVLAFGVLMAALWGGAVVLGVIQGVRRTGELERVRTPTAQSRNRREDGAPAE